MTRRTDCDRWLQGKKGHFHNLRTRTRRCFHTCCLCSLPTTTVHHQSTIQCRLIRCKLRIFPGRIVSLCHKNFSRTSLFNRRGLSRSLACSTVLLDSHRSHSRSKNHRILFRQQPICPKSYCKQSPRQMSNRSHYLFRHTLLGRTPSRSYSNLHRRSSLGIMWFRHNCFSKPSQCRSFPRRSRKLRKRHS